VERTRDFLAAFKDGPWYDSGSRSGFPNSVHMKSARSLSLFRVLFGRFGNPGGERSKICERYFLAENPALLSDSQKHPKRG
jgi:hypothetical protein